MSNFSLSSDIKINNQIVNQDERIIIISGFRRAYGLGVGENFILIPDFETGLIYEVSLEENETKILYREKDKLKYVSFLQKFKKNKLGKEIVQPHDIIIDEKSNIYVSEMGLGKAKGEGKITVFNKEYKLTAEIGSKMHDNLGMISPVMISKILDIYYVSEFGGHKILRFDKNFNFIDWIGRKGEIDEKITKNSWTKSKQFINFDLNKPHAIKLGPDKNIYIVDSGNHRILRFNLRGEFNGWIGKNKNGEINRNWSKTGEASSGHELGAFNAPCDLIISDNFLYVSEVENNRISKIGLNGKSYGWIGFDEVNNQFIWSKDINNKIDLKNPFGIKLEKNTFFVADRGHNRIMIISSENLFN
jgi:hypothetical protein